MFKLIINLLLILLLCACFDHNTLDQECQRTIVEDYLKDNFDFDSFSSVDWADPSSFGDDCNCVNPSNKPIEDHMLMPDLGINKANYLVVAIKGDGSCWIRSAIQALLFHIFQDQGLFKHFIKKVKEASVQYSDVPGFAQRFRADDLTTLLNTLNSMSAKNRLAQFNKSKVDLFLDYSFRAFLHAKDFKNYLEIIKNNQWKKKQLENYIKSEQKRLKDYLISHSRRDTAAANMVLADYFLPSRPYVYFAAEFDIENFSLGFAKWYEPVPEYMHLSLNQAYVRDMTNFLMTNRLSFDEVLNDYLLDQSEDRSLGIRAMSLLRDLNINSLAALHTHESMNVISYRQFEGHVALMLHKDAAIKFGL